MRSAFDRVSRKEFGTKRTSRGCLLPYRAMAGENQLPWLELGELHQAVSAFLNPLLGNEVPNSARWDVESWSWNPPGPAAAEGPPERAVPVVGDDH